MRTIYHQGKRRGWIPRVVLAGAFLALLLSFFINISAVQRILMPPVLKIYSPFRSLGNSFLKIADNFIINFQKKKKMSVRINALEEKISELESKTTLAETLEKENQTLRSLLNLKINYEFITGAVLYSAGNGFLDTVIVDVGEAAGVKEGMAATAFGNVFLGTVSEVNQNSSRIKLASSPGSETGAFLEELNMPVTAKGRGGGNLMISLPGSFEVQTGEHIIYGTSPRLLIGVAEKIKKDSVNPLQEIFFRLPVNILNLRYVTIIK